MNFEQQTENAPKVAISFKASPASKVKIAEFAERNGQSVSEFCEMHILDACHRLAIDGESWETGTLVEEIQGVFRESFEAFRENILELLEEREVAREETGEQVDFLGHLGLSEKSGEKLRVFLEEAVEYSASEDEAPLDEAGILQRMLVYACKNLSSKPTFFGGPYVGEVRL